MISATLTGATYLIPIERNPCLQSLFKVFLRASFHLDDDFEDFEPAYDDPPMQGRNYLVGADNQPIGGFTLGRMGRRIGFLTNLNIQPELRGQGFGLAAMKLAEGLARREDRSRMFLWTNQSLCPFYERQGYRSGGPVAQGPTATVYPFTKDLAP